MIVNLIFFIITIGIIVLVHELGHLIVAKRNNVHCYEFSIGMGPKIKQVYQDKTGTVYSLRAIPIGGYVMMAGEDASQMFNDNIDPAKYFSNATKWAKTKILLAGSVMNFLLGIFLLTIVFFFGGYPTYLDNNISVTANSPLEAADIETTDKILQLDDTKINKFSDIATFMSQSDGSAIEVKYYDTSDEKEKIVSITPQKSEENSYFIGVTVGHSEEFKLFKSFFMAIIATFLMIMYVFISLFSLLGATYSISDLSGPVGILTMGEDIVKGGLVAMLGWIAFLSINIGTFNLLPIPGLDGGRILLVVIAKIRGRELSSKTEEKILMIGIYFLLAILLIVTFNDIINIFK